MLATASCEDVLAPLESVATSDLLILPLQSTAPAPATVSRRIAVGGPTTQVIALTHQDQFLTPFAEVTFPPGSIVALNGAALGSGDSVLVTVQARGGEYGVTVSPSGLEFSGNNPPSVRFRYGRYGDFSVIQGSPTYADPQAYAAALEVWDEATLGRWRMAPGSGPSGTDAVGASLTGPGSVLVAARR